MIEAGDTVEMTAYPGKRFTVSGVNPLRKETWGEQIMHARITKEAYGHVWSTLTPVSNLMKVE